MKRFTLICLLACIVCCFSFSAMAADRGAIEKGVTAVVTSGHFDDATSKANAPEGLYIFIMDEGGELIVHPKKDAIKNLNSPKFKVIYDQLIKATPSGTWVQYQWNGQEKNTFVKKAGNKIVGCGY